MVINLYKHRLPVTLICLVFVFIPLFFKFGHKSLSPERRQESSYGRFLNWQEVNKIFPQYAVLTVTDLDTGQQFCVQRRAGYYHADVQPLTAADTVVMKKIYHGKWSWKRRAVTVQIDDGIKIAASMNGMPHGQGAIKDNHFNGHFCIHFADSKTHGSKKVDLAHQMMVWKAANIIEEHLADLSAEKTTELFFTALNQGDRSICTAIIASQDETCWKVLQEIEYVRIFSIASSDVNDSYRVNLQVKYKDVPREINQVIIIKLFKKASTWQIDPAGLITLHI